MSDDADIIRVPKARLREVKGEIDALKAERDRLVKELEELREEHENLRAHLKGSIQEVARLTRENERLRG